MARPNVTPLIINDEVLSTGVTDGLTIRGKNYDTPMIIKTIKIRDVYRTRILITHRVSGQPMYQCSATFYKPCTGTFKEYRNLYVNIAKTIEMKFSSAHRRGVKVSDDEFRALFAGVTCRDTTITYTQTF
jgi:hypothetical protein